MKETIIWTVKSISTHDDASKYSDWNLTVTPYQTEGGMLFQVISGYL